MVCSEKYEYWAKAQGPSGRGIVESGTESAAWVGGASYEAGSETISFRLMLVLPAKFEDVLRLNIFTLRCGGWERKDRRWRKEKGMTGVRGGGGILERCMCRIFLNVAKTFNSLCFDHSSLRRDSLNLLVRPEQPVGVMHGNQKRPVMYTRKTAENTSRGESTIFTVYRTSVKGQDLAGAGVSLYSL